MKKLLFAFFIFLPQMVYLQSLVSTGNEVIHVSPNTILFSVNGLELKGSATNRLSLPQPFTFNNTIPANGRVLMTNDNVMYQVRQVATGQTALFNTDAPYNASRTVAQMTLINQSSLGDFNLRLLQTSHVSFNDIPLEWIITKSNYSDSDTQDLIFKWGPEVEPTTLPFKSLFFFNTTTNQWNNFQQQILWLMKTTIP